MRGVNSQRRQAVGESRGLSALKTKQTRSSEEGTEGAEEVLEIPVERSSVLGNQRVMKIR